MTTNSVSGGEVEVAVPFLEDALSRFAVPGDIVVSLWLKAAWLNSDSKLPIVDELAKAMASGTSTVLDVSLRSVRPETGGSKVHYIFDAFGNFTGSR